jgi:hypothetical protein
MTHPELLIPLANWFSPLIFRMFEYSGCALKGDAPTVSKFGMTHKTLALHIHHALRHTLGATRDKYCTFAKIYKLLCIPSVARRHTSTQWSKNHGIEAHPSARFMHDLLQATYL